MSVAGQRLCYNRLTPLSHQPGQVVLDDGSSVLLLATTVMGAVGSTTRDADFAIFSIFYCIRFVLDLY